MFRYQKKIVILNHKRIKLQKVKLKSIYKNSKHWFLNSTEYL